MREQFQANEDEAARLLTAFSDEQLNWQPDNGRAWSIAQCVEHLALANEQYLSAMLPPIAAAPAARPSGVCEVGLFSRFFVRALEPPARFRVPAPKTVLPASRIGGAQALESFRESHRKIADGLAAMADKDPTAIRFTNPFAPVFRLTAGSAFHIMAAHERRHLWQARNVSEQIRLRS